MMVTTKVSIKASYCPVGTRFPCNNPAQSVIFAFAAFFLVEKDHKQTFCEKLWIERNIPVYWLWMWVDTVSRVHHKHGLHIYFEEEQCHALLLLELEE